MAEIQAIIEGGCPFTVLPRVTRPRSPCQFRGNAVAGQCPQGKDALIKGSSALDGTDEDEYPAKMQEVAPAEEEGENESHQYVQPGSVGARGLDVHNRMTRLLGTITILIRRHNIEMDTIRAMIQQKDALIEDLKERTSRSQATKSPDIDKERDHTSRVRFPLLTMI